MRTTLKLQSQLPKSARQLGFTLLEVIISLGIMSAATVGLATLASRYSEDTVTGIAASQMQTFAKASNAYIKENYAAIQAVATPTSPALINVSTLITSGKLPTGFSAINAKGQTMCALVIEPTVNRLQGLLVSEGGTPVSDLDLGAIAASMGGTGGAVYSTADTTIRGAVGGWAIPTSTFDNLTNNLGTDCAGNPGRVRVVTGTPVMALWLENGDSNSAFLARDAVPGRPEMNAVNTPIVMNSVQTVGAVCTTTGAIAQDGAGGIVSCKGGKWETSGDGKCVATTSDLNALQKDGRCYNGVGLPNSPAGGDWVFVEVYRHTNDANYYVAQRVTGMTGAAAGKVWQRNQQSGTQAGGWSAWSQQADPTIGITANQIYASGSAGSYGATTIAGQKNGWTGLEFRDSAGNYQINQMTNRSNIGYYDAATGRWLSWSDTSGNTTLDQTPDWSSGRINPGWAVETWGCSTGQIAKAAYTIADGWAYNGKTLSCVNGVWKSSSSGGAKVQAGAWGGQCAAIYPPAGTSVSTHAVMYSWRHTSQCNWEQSHATGGGGQMYSDGIYVCGTPYCPSNGSYIVTAVPY